MSVVIDTKELNEEHPIAIHKLSADRFELLPGKRTKINMIVFARRIGLHSLKYFKIIDDAQRDKHEHRAKGYSYSVPKFEVVGEVLSSE